ncbi:MAG: sensor histidine kinase [Deltaproteobacteria bacterium]|nr:sensor histidine kinase [Nannocystaceae bacterium]
MNALRRVLASIVLPATITEFEQRYLLRMNRIGFGFLALHIPALAIIAAFNDTEPGLAALLASLVLLGPALAYRAFDNPRALSLVYGVTTMSMGGLLVHFGQGPMQIEMHFYFFALLAMLVLFGNPLVIVLAAATVAVHHLLLWLVLPGSVFNYDAQVWVVVVHASFVVLESIAACFIARSFFDNVIGLERIGRRRALELAERNREMRRVLDNVQQGLLTLDRAGIVADERSAVVEQWLGAIGPRASFVDVLRKVDGEVAAWFEVGWTELQAAVMPIELTLAQLPSRLEVAGRHLELTYVPIEVVDDRCEGVLVMFSDISARVERARLEADQRELSDLLERYAADRRSVIEFLEEGNELIAQILHEDTPRPVLARALHTFKGNAGVLGMTPMATTCHEIESLLAEGNEVRSRAALRMLAERWALICNLMKPLVGEPENRAIEIEVADHRAVLSAVQRRRPYGEIEAVLSSWTLEPMAKRLERVAEQTRRIAQRAGKGDIDVVITHHDVRLSAAKYRAFWSAFVHVVRNAVAHGIEPAATRAALGKVQRGRIEISTRYDGEELVIAIEDDGRGVDRDALAHAATRFGMTLDGPDEVLGAMFRDGVSTAGAVREIAGRGLGMGAVRSACVALGGRVVARTEPGRFTRFEFRFPEGRDDQVRTSAA